MRHDDVRSSSFDGTVDASAFAAGAAAFARRWEENAEKNENGSGGESDRVTARWVAEPDPLVRRRVAPGFLALEGALVECVSDVFEKDTADTADDSEGALFEDAAEEDDLADLASAATRGADVPASGKEETKTTRKTTLLFSYHAVYSPSYRAPVLVARARLAEAAASAPRKVIVKEKVKEERTFQDERGYLVVEEVWVEKEVEKELPPEPTFAPAPPVPKPAPKKKARKAENDDDSDDGDDDGKKKKKPKGGGGKAKAAPAAPNGSIKSFFGKK